MPSTSLSIIKEVNKHVLILQTPRGFWSSKTKSFYHHSLSWKLWICYSQRKTLLIGRSKHSSPPWSVNVLMHWYFNPKEVLLLKPPERSWTIEVCTFALTSSCQRNFSFWNWTIMTLRSTTIFWLTFLKIERSWHCGPPWSPTFHSKLKSQFIFWNPNDHDLVVSLMQNSNQQWNEDVLVESQTVAKHS